VSAAIWLGVAALGSLGALARFLVDGWISARTRRGLPLGTLAVNASGALLLGLVAGVALTGDALLLVGAATIGSYTTFSTWMFETHRLGEEGQVREAVANVLVSVILGVAAVALGRAIGEWL
jgi:fluoride exporter